MTNSSMNAQNAASSFSWKWYLKTLSHPDKPVNVFSAFSCGGGSTMGYKLAGFHVIGNVELDNAINAVYVHNHHPKYNYNMDLRDFNKLSDLPSELYELDILDGSPPCSTFTTSGKRSKVWGVKKKFREGQKAQVLDDLFFVFLETVKKLKPRIVIAENITGLLKGNAKGYVNEILKVFRTLGYEVQLFRLNSANMGVPQYRERVFFIANNQGYTKLKLKFNMPIIKFGEVRTEHGKDFVLADGKYKKLLELARPGDKSIKDVRKRFDGSSGEFNHMIVADDDVCPCLTAGSNMFRLCDRKYFSDGDYINVQTFPQDYDFCGQDVQYVCGMSVPPVMMAHIAKQVWEQWLRK